MPRPAILISAAVLLLLIAVQFALPPLAENRIEDRLTAKGGSAQVELEAIPSPRLLFKEGDSVNIRAQGIDVPLTKPGKLGDLDGFDEVDIRVEQSKAGPFHVGLLTLTRKDGEHNYQARIEATVTAADLSAYAGSQLGGGLGGFLGGLAGGAMPGGDTEVPIDLQATLRSDNGQARAVAVEGSVAGIPAGPLVEALATALAGRF